MKIEANDVINGLLTEISELAKQVALLKVQLNGYLANEPEEEVIESGGDTVQAD